MSNELPPEARGYDIVFKTNSLLTDETGDSVLCDFYYLFSRVNPLAVEFFLHYPENNERSKWQISRDVLATCALAGEPAGEGDFRAEVNRQYQLVGPQGEPAPETLLFHLTGMDVDHSVMHAHAFVLRHVTSFFLNKTLALVPRGEERYDIDRLIDQLLGV